MPNLMIRMSAEQHAKLEAHRVAFGLRSLNAAMLHLIDGRFVIGASAAERGWKPDPTAGSVLMVDDEPKPAKPFKSRLKGEWKAP